MMKKIILMVFVSIGANAANLTIPNVFVANTPAVASEVNGNFGAVEAAVDDNNARIAALEATIISLEARLSAVENNTVLELDGLLGYSEFNGYPTAEFNAVNVQVNDGTGSTHLGGVNGLGNVIIGYNEASNFAQEFCSDPQYTDSVSCIGNLQMRGRNVYRGSHNLILGSANSYDDHAAIIAGRYNVSNGNFASVLSGNSNLSSGLYSAILGGDNNTASGQTTTVSGGRRGQATINSASVSGGWGNIASGIASSVTGGNLNRATALRSTISGGASNRANGTTSTVSGGSSRTTSGSSDWVAGSLFEDN